ncbi:DEAD/DEAH box helicase family protein [bacterium]|nr:DEAD/DEAH box helicase family protein [bacterium]
MILKVVDAGCGVGKTTAMINYINQDKEDSKFLYITPFLTEVERIKNACKDKNFQEPAELPTKTEDLLRLVEKGYNIVSTHALFKKLTDKVLDLTQFNDYVLIIDEAADVLEEIEITKNDLKTIITEYTTIDENNTVHWNEWNNDYEGRFEDYKNMIQMGGVKAHRSDTGEVVSLVWAFPISIFESFKEVYILTYMFNGQKAYYEYNKVDIIKLYVKDFQLTTEPQVYNYEEQKKLITVIEDEKLNAIGNNRGSLSMSWFSRNAKTALMKQLQNNINNFFKNIVKGTPINQKLWTTFKEYSEVVKGKGYTNAFVPINIRATNDYKESTAVAYIANRYMKPTLKHFFEVSGIEVDEDTYALSELIQFIYRSAIRDGKPITVYIPSKRMRELFIDWINKKDE